MPIEAELFLPDSIKNNNHMKEITEFFGELTHAPISVPDTARFVFICFTNRCGSNYLAELLASDHKLGKAEEPLNADLVIRRSKEKGFQSFHKYFSFLSKKIIKNDFIVIKISLPQIETLGKAGILAQIMDRSHFVVIERSDKLAQAVSHLIAFQTGKFMSLQKTDDVRAEPKFNRKRLDSIIEHIVDSYRNFNMFFSKNGIVPINVNYERMIAQPVATLAFVGNRIGIPDLEYNPRAMRLERQAGPLNEEWRTRYLNRLER